MKKLFEIEKLRSELISLMSSSSLRQREIEKKTGVSQATISNFLSGKRNLNGECALRIKYFLESVAPAPSTPEATP